MNIDEIKLQYECQGFVHLPGVLDASTVARLKKAFDATAAAYDDTWKAEVKVGRADKRYCDLPNILDSDDVFVDIVDLPNIVPVLISLVGPDVQLNHTHARLFPPGETFTAPWHSDLKEVIGIDLAHSTSFFLKIHYFFEDLRPDQGCLAFIPGSHRYPPDFPRPSVADLERTAVAVKIVPKAGDLVIFNTHLLHMALDNDSPLVRKSLIYAFSHFWVKHYGNAVPSNLEKHATTRLRKQLFGVEEEGISYFNQRYNENVKPSMMNSIQLASRRLVRRLMKSTSVSWKKG